jgi:predicted nucleic acid-binding protein
MTDKVVDASAVAALLFGEPDGVEVATGLGGCNLVAQYLLPFEIANVCLKKCRRYPEQKEALLVAQRMLGRLAIRYVDIDLNDVILLADKTGLTSYDASYLWLSRLLQAELVTLDQQLARAAMS